MKCVARSVRSHALLLMALLPGCYSYHAYQVGGPEGREQGNQPATEWQHRTLHAFLWGAVRHDLPIENCRLGNGQRLGVEEVKVGTNLGYLVLSVLTLGIWVPVDVSWRCARPPVTTGTLR
jgi:hypothetical protein